MKTNTDPPDEMMYVLEMRAASQVVQGVSRCHSADSDALDYSTIGNLMEVLREETAHKRTWLGTKSKDRVILVETVSAELWIGTRDNFAERKDPLAAFTARDGALGARVLRDADITPEKIAEVLGHYRTPEAVALAQAQTEDAIRTAIAPVDNLVPMKPIKIRRPPAP